MAHKRVPRHVTRRTAIGTMLQRRTVTALGVLVLAVVVGLTILSLRWLDFTLTMASPEQIETARRTVIAVASALVLLVLGVLALASRLIEQRVTAPALALATIAERVAAGDLAVPLGATRTPDALGRLTRATAAMVFELRNLVRAMRESARETAAMSAEITAGTEQMSASASEMARTSGELSHRSGEMARAVAESAAGAATLLALARSLAEGARDGVDRNAALTALARANHARLAEGNAVLASVHAEAVASATSAEALAAASEEIRAFVTLVRRIARQSKLLALNAAMEAARAGEHGDGFAVVATEIRALAAHAAASAERTETTVHDVLERVRESQEASARAVAALDSVRDATGLALTSFEEVERAVAAAETWTVGIDRAAAQASELATDATDRLRELAAGTETVAATMQEVAAASQQQSAGTQQIAAAASALAEASRRLLDLVSTFRLEEAPVPKDTAAMPIPATAEMPSPLAMVPAR